MEELDINKEEPKNVLKFFEEISNIPRESGNEKEIMNYLIGFAKKRNLEYYTDEYFNIIIRKEASSGYKNKDYLAFQGHTDMVCEKEEWSNHNFLKDSIKLFKDGDFIKANGTTLGSDNGIGVAYMLALLDSDDIKTSNIECIFTVQEETTMIGAKCIDMNQIKSNKIISLDCGSEGKMVISSANCMEWFGKINLSYTSIENLDDFECYELKYYNFKGGHSGSNIADEKRGNPIKLGIDILSKIDEVYISQISGGSKVNVIPRDFKVKFACKNEYKEQVENEIKNQLEFYGEDVKIELNKIEELEKVYSKDTTNNIIGFINSYSNGAIEFDEYKNVVLSANFAAINQIEDYIRLDYSLRSNNMESREKYLKDLEENLIKYDIENIWFQELPGFEPDYESSLVQGVSKIYKSLFNKDMEKIIVQGVVEGGFFKYRKNDLQYICIGPESFDAHSPKERVSIKSIQKVWKLLTTITEEF